MSIWYGTGKPDPVNDFLRPFVNELKHLIANGISINGKKILIKIRCFICDTPARSLLKGCFFLKKKNSCLYNYLLSFSCFVVPAVVNFNAYFGCQKCCVCGQYFNQFRVMSFPRTACIKRTNQSFRQRNQPEHHREYRSILEELDIDMVADFPTSDPLHLIELGIMKRCLTRWKDGTKSYKHKFNKADLNRINSLLIRANAEMPFEIHRAVRDLNSLHYWKGTEFRTFLLYVGIIVLKDVLIAEEYSHFKLLVCAVIYCSSEHYKRAVNNSIIVDELIGDYIEQYIEIYGEHTISSNIHNLAHLLNDVRRFGGLNSISTYPFENCLRVMKLKLRAMNKPMEQIARRMSEISALMDYEREI